MIEYDCDDEKKCYQVISEEVVPLVHVDAGYFVGHDLVEELFLGASPDILALLTQRTVD